jgi:hypothetical protein
VEHYVRLKGCIGSMRCKRDAYYFVALTMHVLSEVQATVLEEAGKPEKALEELAKKEGKIVCLSSCCG